MSISLTFSSISISKFYSLCLTLQLFITQTITTSCFRPIQRAKLQSFLHYFDLIGESDNDQSDLVSFSRQVMSGKQWLTIEDWLDSCLPLCPMTVRNEGRIEEAETQCLRICFSSARIGGAVLCEGSSQVCPGFRYKLKPQICLSYWCLLQECTEFCTVPELICILASVEALEDNEVLIVKDAYQVTKIVSPREKTYIEKFDKPNKVSKLMHWNKHNVKLNHYKIVSG